MSEVVDQTMFITPNRLRVAKGETIFFAGEKGDEMFMIETGRVLIWRDYEDGKTETLGVIERGQIFGEMALFDDAPRMASAKALEDTVLRQISRDNFQKRIANVDPLIQYVIKNLVIKVRSMGEYIEVLRGELEDNG